MTLLLELTCYSSLHLQLQRGEQTRFALPHLHLHMDACPHLFLLTRLMSKKMIMLRVLAVAYRSYRESNSIQALDAIRTMQSISWFGCSSNLRGNTFLMMTQRIQSIFKIMSRALQHRNFPAAGEKSIPGSSKNGEPFPRRFP